MEYKTECSRHYAAPVFFVRVYDQRTPHIESRRSVMPSIFWRRRDNPSSRECWPTPVHLFVANAAIVCMLCPFDYTSIYIYIYIYQTLMDTTRCKTIYELWGTPSNSYYLRSDGFNMCVAMGLIVCRWVPLHIFRINITSSRGST